VSTPSPVRKLGLGTVQFGLAYGVTNDRGQVPAAEVMAIVDAALAAGIDLFDTAAAYGDSERVIGQVLDAERDVRIVSKLPPVAAAAIDATEIARCRALVDRSLALLRRPALYGLLLHHPDDLHKLGSERLVALLAELKAAGLAVKIGVSAYERAQIELALDRLPVDIVQVPVNLLDQRLLVDGTLDRLKAQRIEVHARSAFLQGALLAEPGRLPDHFAPHRERLLGIGALARRAGFSRLALCLRFVLAQPVVDRVIVGVTRRQELAEILAAATGTTDLPADLAALACYDPALVNPSLWPPPVR
jgi:aryl-alcohol dehydrogenase-like predicted oxidoreductase